MGEINIKELLSKDNPRAKKIDIYIVSNAIVTYHAASKNIKENGSIVMHPRTGSPIENPYIKIQSQQSTILYKYKHIKSDTAILGLDV